MKSIEEAAKEYANNNFELCKYPNYSYNKRISDFDKINESFKAGAEFAQHWIPVEQELPEKMKLVQVRNDNCTPEYSHAFIDKTGKWWNPYNDCELNPNPIYWLPIELK